MPMPMRFRGVLLRHTPATAITPQGVNKMSIAKAAQVKPHLASLRPRTTMPARAGRSWSAMGADPAAHPWEAAQAVADAAFASSGDEQAYAEPNLEFAMPEALAARIASAAKPCVSIPDQRLCMWPPAPGVQPPDWHLDASTLRQARLDPAFAGLEADPARWRVTIGHLDTGYSDVHETKPRGLRADLARNLVDGEDPTIAIDPATTTALLSQPGHGTATLGLLAGGKCSKLGGDDLGGIPFAQIVPVRMSNYVWHIWTDVIPQGIAWALARNCDVISLSHGGLATRAWADAVNAAYEAGCVICAASGDNFGGLPIRDMIWPARFRRVVCVSGATFDRKPYFDAKFGLSVLEGSWGPLEAMNFAVAAFTPNVLWPTCRDATTHQYTRNEYALDGGGTSASTPQVAAAVALYAQKYHEELKVMPGWQRVETIRAALYAAAVPPAQESDRVFFGAGLLDAAAMLSITPAQVGPVENLGDDEISFMLLRNLPGWDRLRPGQQRMLEVEATHIAMLHPALMERVLSWEAHGGPPSGSELLRFLDSFKNVLTPRPSSLLYHFLDDAMSNV